MHRKVGRHRYTSDVHYCIARCRSLLCTGQSKQPHYRSLLCSWQRRCYDGGKTEDAEPYRKFEYVGGMAISRRELESNLYSGLDCATVINSMPAFSISDPG